MKKFILLLSFVLFLSFAEAQTYDIKKLKVISTIWGETYLFHPAIIRADKNLEWEKQLVNFLPTIKGNMNNDEFLHAINSGLLSVLNDPFTTVQEFTGNIEYKNLENHPAFDYVKITEENLSNVSNIGKMNNNFLHATTEKPLVVDLRISGKINEDYHVITFFEYFVSMFIDKPVKRSSVVTREHFGWDEKNDWWHYEQRWKLASINKHNVNTSWLKPFNEYAEQLQNYPLDFDIVDFKTVNRPVYFVANNNFMSYYGQLLTDLKLFRKNTFIIWENTGTVTVPELSEFKKYTFSNFEFILNPAFYVDNGMVTSFDGYETSSLTTDVLINYINAPKKQNINHPVFSFNIEPVVYVSANQSLTVEEKILGIIKLHTIIKYFFVNRNNVEAYWDKALEDYLDLVQTTNSDKEYYQLISKMTAPLKDSHISLFHPSIVDFSKMFVAPVNFDWVEEKVIVTKLDSSIMNLMKVGDEIVRIDGLAIDVIMETAAQSYSYSNRQSQIARVINPFHFVGEQNSIMKLEIKTGDANTIVELPRTLFIMQFQKFEDERIVSDVLAGNIGYLNMQALTNSTILESELVKMKNTNGLIIDLRASYPTWSYSKFLQMLCNKEVPVRITQTPVVSSRDADIVYRTIEKCVPSSDFNFNKPVLVLIDKKMVSRPEAVASALKSLPNVRLVGEQTQGTDGETSMIYLPGGGTITFTGQLIKYGNGEDFFGNGLIPDIEVKKTVKGIINGEDEILTKALEILQNNK